MFNLLLSTDTQHQAAAARHMLRAGQRQRYRVESSRNRESGGAGLGLAIAQELAGALNATLTQCNRPTGGLEVRLRLPGVDTA